MFYRKHSRVTAPHSDVMMTKQSAKDECDINKILNQYQKTGILMHVQSARGTYEDLPSSVDYQDALNTQMAATEAFDALPAKVRDHFQNDPYLFLHAFTDESQSDKLREFGLLEPLPEGRLPQAPSGGAAASQGAPTGSAASSGGASTPAPARSAPGGSQDRL